METVPQPTEQTPSPQVRKLPQLPDPVVPHVYIVKGLWTWKIEKRPPGRRRARG